jgi:nicotinamide-nucleotide amidase
MSAAADVHARLGAIGATVAVAESLTGGLLCAALTETAGASATVRGGLVVYATDLKSRLAAVDPEVALALARGARTRLDATFGLGVTGVAGPDAQDAKPVGTVFAAVAGPHGGVVREHRLSGERAAIRAAAVQACLNLLLTELDRRAARYVR